MVVLHAGPPQTPLPRTPSVCRRACKALLPSRTRHINPYPTGQSQWPNWEESLSLQPWGGNPILGKRSEPKALPAWAVPDSRGWQGE